MKKLIIAAAFILLAGVAFGQHLQKGVILGVHHMTITLKPDVTMDQFIDALSNKWIPEAEKIFDGWKPFIVKGNKGEHVNEYGLVWYIDSMHDHDKSFKSDGSLTDEVAANWEKLQPINEELEKLGTWSSTYTDWVVQ
jgi:hypothetical protein